jgi:hypothetical protein
MAARPQGEAEIPLDALRRTSFPKLVTSGGHHPVFEAICDALHRELKTERAVIRGAGHNVQFTGAPFNDRLETFLKGASARRPFRPITRTTSLHASSSPDGEKGGI